MFGSLGPALYSGRCRCGKVRGCYREVKIRVNV